MTAFLHTISNSLFTNNVIRRYIYNVFNTYKYTDLQSDYSYKGKVVSLSKYDAIQACRGVDVGGEWTWMVSFSRTTQSPEMALCSHWVSHPRWCNG
jgi:hypothetical protein